MYITQEEADKYIKIEKITTEDRSYVFPDLNEKLSIDLISIDRKHEFILDINRGSISLKKCTYQNRYSKTVILLRLDINGPPHTNPDGKEISGSHIHVYKAGFGDKWAYELSSDFNDITKLDITLNDFMTYCNIIDRPKIEPIVSLYQS